MKRKSILSMLLPLCLLLCACGGRKSTAPQSDAAAYTSIPVNVDLSVAELTASGVGDGCLYLAGREEQEYAESEEDGEFTSGGFSVSASDDGGFTFYSGAAGRAVLYRMDAATGTLTRLEGYVPGEGTAVAAIVPCGDGSLWVLEQTDGLEADIMDLGGMAEAAVAADGDGISDSGSKVWRRLDASSGKELDRIDVTVLPQALGVQTLDATRIDREGRLYAASGTTLTVLDASLSPLFTCRTQEAIERLISLGDGGVGAVTAEAAGRTVYPVNPEQHTLGGACSLNGSGNQIYAGNGSYSFLYNSGDSLYGWPQGAASPVKILSWSGAGVDMGQVAALAFLEDGQGVAVTRDNVVWPISYSAALLSPVGEEELAGRTVLTLATLGLDSDTRARILEFNRTSGTCRIEVRDYSEYNTPNDSTAGVNKLNTEILAGNLPDLLDLSDAIPLRQYAARGLLEDLWPYIESDPGLGREGVMERVLEAAETGGKLYRVFPRFTIETAAGNPAIVGNRNSWTLDELRDALEKTNCSVLGPDETKSSVLEALFSESLDQFIDWATGTARFDSAEFEAILEFCNTFPSQVQSQGEESSPYTWVVRGEQMLLPVSLEDLASLQVCRTLFGGSAAFVGYPGGNGVQFGVEGGMAMLASCRDKNGAWNFLRQALLEESGPFTPGFSVNRENFEKTARESMEVSYAKDENGDPIIGPDGEPLIEGSVFIVLDDHPVLLKPPTQDDYDQVMALYRRADSIAGRDENIWAIVKDCAGAYFAGDRTVEDAAGTIQSRIELYLNEQQ